MILKIKLNKLENEVILDSLFLKISFLIQNHGVMCINEVILGYLFLEISFLIQNYSVTCIRVGLVATGAIKYYLN